MRITDTEHGQEVTIRAKVTDPEAGQVEFDTGWIGYVDPLLELGDESILLEAELGQLPTEAQQALEHIPEGKLHSIDINHAVTIWTIDSMELAAEHQAEQKQYLEWPQPDESGAEQLTLWGQPLQDHWLYRLGVLGDDNGAFRIAQERLRQIEVEGHDPEDDQHRYEAMELLQGAICYAWHALGLSNDQVPAVWPWSALTWKPDGPVRDLEKAGALIAAQIDRLLADGMGR